MKKRFENARVGDAVYCRLSGEGVITSIDPSPTNWYPIRVRFANKICRHASDGRFSSHHAEPTLFYRSETNNYLTERPIKWCDVKPGTMCYVWNKESPYIHKARFRFVSEGKPWFEMTENVVKSFDYAEVVNDE